MVEQAKLGKSLLARYDDIIHAWVISGDTWDYKERIAKKATFALSKKEYRRFGKVWIFEGKTLPEEISRLVDWGKSGGEKPQDAPPAERGETAKVEEQPTESKKRSRHTKLRPAKRAIVKKQDSKERVIPPTGDTFVAPSWWNLLCTYLMKGAARPAIAIVGPAGNGKTTTAEAALRALYGDEGYIVIDAEPTTEAIDLIGTNTLTPQGEVWKDGKVTKAFREGKAVLINEYDALDPRVAMCLQSALQDAGPSGKGRYVTTPGNRDGDRVYPAGECPVILTMNTYGSGPNRQYVGRNKQDAANLDRLTFISTTYENEDQILRRRGHKAQTAKQIVAWAHRTRQNIERAALTIILSNRTLIRMAQGIDVYGWTFEQAVEQEFMGRLDAETREQVK